MRVRFKRKPGRQSSMSRIFSSDNTEPYLIKHRLGEVLSLLQVLVTTRDGVLPQSMIESRPISSNGWQSLAMEHPEFFRIVDDRFVLLCKYAAAQAGEGVLSSDTPQVDVSTLIATATDMHDRAQRREDRKAEHKQRLEQDVKARREARRETAAIVVPSLVALLVVVLESMLG